MHVTGAVDLESPDASSCKRLWSNYWTLIHPTGENSPHHSQPGQFEFDNVANFKRPRIAFEDITDE